MLRIINGTKTVSVASFNTLRDRATLSGSCRASSSAAKMNGEDLKTLRSRLLYQSKKRGILENDIIIGGFAARHLDELDEKELHSYDRIINNGQHMEWDLYYYFIGKKSAPAELESCPVFKKMCAFAHSKKPHV